MMHPRPVQRIPKRTSSTAEHVRPASGHKRSVDVYVLCGYHMKDIVLHNQCAYPLVFFLQVKVRPFRGQNHLADELVGPPFRAKNVSHVDLHEKKSALSEGL
jgi:hypothetical protein